MQTRRWKKGGWITINIKKNNMTPIIIGLFHFLPRQGYGSELPWGSDRNIFQGSQGLNPLSLDSFSSYGQKL